VSALFVAREGLDRIRHPEQFHGTLVLVVTVIAATGSFFVHRSISGIDESVQDHKHKASVLHVLADLVISIIVVIAVLLTMLLNMPAMDGWGAIAVSIWMIVRGTMLWRETSRHVHDKTDHGHTHHH
jgi:Co/Zn/Cd efflux system component